MDSFQKQLPGVDITFFKHMETHSFLPFLPKHMAGRPVTKARGSLKKISDVAQSVERF